MVKIKGLGINAGPSASEVKRHCLDWLLLRGKLSRRRNV